MKKGVKWISVTMALGLTASVIVSGCAKSEEPGAASAGSSGGSAVSAEKTYNGVDVSKEVKIKWLGVGGNQKDKDAVLTEINKRLKEKVNVTLELDSIDWADWYNKYNLVLSSGEDYDVIYAASWTDVAVQTRKGAFKDLTEMLEQNAPTISQNWTEDTWNESKIDGRVFMIPSFSDEYNWNGFLYREDLRKKYNVPEIKTMADMGAYFEAIKQNEKEMVPYKPATDESWTVLAPYVQEKGDQPDVTPPGILSMQVDDQDGSTLAFLSQSPIYAEAFKTIKSWADKGYWPKDSLANKTESCSAFKEGKAAACQGGYWAIELNYKEIMKAHPDWEIGSYAAKVGGKYFPKPPSIKNGVAILNSSKNAERALMTIDAIYSDPELWTLCMYGIQGRNYDIDANGAKTLPEGSQSTDYEGTYFSGMRYKLVNPFKDDPSSPNAALKEEYAKIAHFPKLGSFVFNSEPVKNEYAAISAVKEKYNPSLSLGLVSDVDKVLADYDKEMKAAGADKVMAEYKKQMQEWLAKN